ncbi:MAG: cyclase family protein [Firmicutes bacterium]|nr:cyclase family protein [Bacillota bacterium]
MWDLTHSISEDMLLYPGIPHPVLRDLATPDRDGYGMSEYTFWNHLGTHIDAPTHFYSDGLSLDQFPISAFIKKVHTVDCQGVEEISAAFLTAQLSRYQNGDGVFLLTGQYRYWGMPAYFHSYPVLVEDGIDFLVHHQVPMIIVDAPSVDPVDTVTFPNHHLLLRHPLLIVENLAYDPTLPKTFQIIALPMKVHRSNGCPARVVALPC